MSTTGSDSSEFEEFDFTGEDLDFWFFRIQKEDLQKDALDISLTSKEVIFDEISKLLSRSYGPNRLLEKDRKVRILYGLLQGDPSQNALAARAHPLKGPRLYPVVQYRKFIYEEDIQESPWARAQSEPEFKEQWNKNAQTRQAAPYRTHQRALLRPFDLEPEFDAPHIAAHPMHAVRGCTVDGATKTGGCVNYTDLDPPPFPKPEIIRLADGDPYHVVGFMRPATPAARAGPNRIFELDAYIAHLQQLQLGDRVTVFWHQDRIRFRQDCPHATIVRVDAQTIAFQCAEQTFQMDVHAPGAFFIYGPNYRGYQYHKGDYLHATHANLVFPLLPDDPTGERTLAFVIPTYAEALYLSRKALKKTALTLTDIRNTLHVPAHVSEDPEIQEAIRAVLEKALDRLPVAAAGAGRRYADPLPPEHSAAYRPIHMAHFLHFQETHMDDALLAPYPWFNRSFDGNAARFRHLCSARDGGRLLQLAIIQSIREAHVPWQGSAPPSPSNKAKNSEKSASAARASKAPLFRGFDQLVRHAPLTLRTAYVDVGGGSLVKVRREAEDESVWGIDNEEEAEDDGIAALRDRRDPTYDQQKEDLQKREVAAGRQRVRAWLHAELARLQQLNAYDLAQLFRKRIPEQSHYDQHANELELLAEDAIQADYEQTQYGAAMRGAELDEGILRERMDHAFQGHPLTDHVRPFIQLVMIHLRWELSEPELQLLEANLVWYAEQRSKQLKALLARHARPNMDKQEELRKGVMQSNMHTCAALFILTILSKLPQRVVPIFQKQADYERDALTHTFAKLLKADPLFLQDARMTPDTLQKLVEGRIKDLIKDKPEYSMLMERLKKDALDHAHKRREWYDVYAVWETYLPAPAGPTGDFAEDVQTLLQSIRRAVVQKKREPISAIQAMAISVIYDNEQRASLKPVLKKLARIEKPYRFRARVFLAPSTRSADAPPARWAPIQSRTPASPAVTAPAPKPSQQANDPDEAIRALVKTCVPDFPALDPASASWDQLSRLNVQMLDAWTGFMKRHEIDLLAKESFQHSVSRLDEAYVRFTTFDLQNARDMRMHLTRSIQKALVRWIHWFVHGKTIPVDGIQRKTFLDAKKRAALVAMHLSPAQSNLLKKANYVPPSIFEKMLSTCCPNFTAFEHITESMERRVSNLQWISLLMFIFLRTTITAFVVAVRYDMPASPEDPAHMEPGRLPHQELEQLRPKRLSGTNIITNILMEWIHHVWMDMAAMLQTYQKNEEAIISAYEEQREELKQESIRTLDAFDPDNRRIVRQAIKLNIMTMKTAKNVRLSDEPDAHAHDVDAPSLLDAPPRELPVALEEPEVVDHDADPADDD